MLTLTSFLVPLAVLPAARPQEVPPGAGLEGGPDDRPNVVLILADDLGYECLGVNGGESYDTPRLDRMAAEGVRFTRCHSTPLCTPSRVQLMTGRYSFRNYVRFGYLDPAEVTLGELFRAAGYATAITGKWQLTYGDPAPERPRELGFQSWCLWNTSEDRGSRYHDPTLDEGGELEVHPGAFGPDLICDRAVAFMEAEREAPYFLYYPMVLPHAPFVQPPAAAGPAAAPPGGASEGEPSGEASAQARFAAMIAHMDHLVGRVLDAAARQDDGRDTLVVFVGDNGTDRRITTRFEGEDVVGGKSRMNVHGTHVPLIAWWPGRAAPAVSGDLVDFTDLLPTLCDAASLERPAGVVLDGVSFLPRLLGEEHTPRAWIFCHYDPRWNVPGRPGRFAQDETHRLHHDGRLVHVDDDPLGERPLEGDGGGARQRLQAVLDAFPPWTPPARARRSDGARD